MPAGTPLGRFHVNGRPARLAIRDDHLHVDTLSRPLHGLTLGDVERAPRDLRLLVLGVSLWLVGGLLTGLLWSQGWATRFVAGAVPWAGVALATLGLLQAATPRAALQVGDLRIEGAAKRVARVADVLRAALGG